MMCVRGHQKGSATVKEVEKLSAVPVGVTVINTCECGGHFPEGEGVPDSEGWTHCNKRCAEKANALLTDKH
jgi:hypothetical protein